ALQALGFMETSNIPVIQDTLIGLPDWSVPNANALAKVNNIIRKLLAQEPQQQPSKQNPGQMITLPSIPVDDFEDSHDFCANAVRAWAQTEDAQEEREKNTQGYSNVIAW